MSKSNDALPQAQNSAQLVYIVTRYGNIIGVYADMQDAQQVQMTFIQKGQICDLLVQVVKPKNFG